MDIGFDELKEKAKNIIRQTSDAECFAITYNTMLQLASELGPEYEMLPDYAMNIKGDDNAYAPPKSREACLHMIDCWDVHRAGMLIEMFPEIVPAEYRKAPHISVEQKNTATGDSDGWVVSLYPHPDTPASRTRSKPSLPE